MKIKKKYNSAEIHEKLKKMKEKKKEMRKQRELYERKLAAKQEPSKISPKQSSRRDRSLNKPLNQSAFDYSLEDLEVSGINFQTTKLRVINSFFKISFLNFIKKEIKSSQRSRLHQLQLNELPVTCTNE